MKVIEYVLRHTWGFRETVRVITTDEFINGRKRKDRSRIDKGTGLSRQSVITGLKKAVEHGYLLVEKKGTDKARLKKIYSLNMENGSLKTRLPGVQKVDPQGIESRPRSEKDT